MRNEKKKKKEGYDRGAETVEIKVEQSGVEWSFHGNLDKCLQGYNYFYLQKVYIESESCSRCTELACFLQP